MISESEYFVLFFSFVTHNKLTKTVDSHSRHMECIIMIKRHDSAITSSKFDYKSAQSTNHRSPTRRLKSSSTDPRRRQRQRSQNWPLRLFAPLHFTLECQNNANQLVKAQGHAAT